MQYGNQHPAMHLIRAIALYALFFAGTMAVALTVIRLDSAGVTDPEAVRVLTWFFNALGVGMLAVFVWATVELSAAIWSISYVRQAAGWVKSRVGGVA